MILGYARVSTTDQNLDGQTDALTSAGVERIFSDKITGTARSRPELDRLLEQLRPGDVVVVTKYDRLARSLKDLLEIVDVVQAKGAGFKSLGENIDTTTPAGRLVFHVFASIAQFERERIVERTREGLAAARKRGRVGGRPPARGCTVVPGQREDHPAGISGRSKWPECGVSTGLNLLTAIIIYWSTKHLANFLIRKAVLEQNSWRQRDSVMICLSAPTSAQASGFPRSSSARHRSNTSATKSAKPRRQISLGPSASIA